MNKVNAGVFLITALLLLGPKLGLPSEFTFDLSKEYQPDFEQPRKYSREEMEALAQEVLAKMDENLGTPFNRQDPQHVQILAEFFGLTPAENLDLYSTPMEEPDIRYFSEVSVHQEKELYPQNAAQLVIRFYWEGLARVTAVHYQLKVVNNRQGHDFQMSRGKVSDIATTAMFDKRPGISIAEAITQKKERYDFGKLIQHLKAKGLPA